MNFDNVVPNVTSAQGNGLIYLYTMDNGKQYVGQTIMNIRTRHAVHKGGTQLVDRHIRTHAWNLRVLGEYPESELDKTERFFISLLDTMSPNGLNLDTGGNIHKHLSEDCRKKLSEQAKGRPAHNKGKKMSDEQRQHLSEVCKGRKLSEETKKKIGAHFKGRKPTEYQLERLREYNHTRVLTLEQRQRMSESLKGKKQPREVAQKSANSRRGLKRSPETRLKQSLALKGKKKSPEACKHNSEAQLRRYAIRKFMTEMMA